MATPNYKVNYDDKRFTEVEADKKAALNEIDVTYGNMINQSDKYYQKQIDAANQYAETQKQIQQQKTDFAIEQIEQQKAQTKTDYLKEQSGAYTDWQKQSGQYGVNAEQMAAQGMQNTGFSESSQVSMFNTYQNRVATARESYVRAIQNYDNAITEARLQNNAALAEIAYNALQTQLELSLQGFQYKNTLIMAKADRQDAIEDRYYNRYQDVVDQINIEQDRDERVRQFEETQKLKREENEEQKRQFEETQKLKRAELAEMTRQFNVQQAAKKANATISSGGGGGGSSKRKTTARNKTIGKTGSDIKGTNKKTTSKEPEVDTKSVLALGFGPISGNRLAELEASGVIQSYVSNGKVYYKKSPFAFNQSKLFG